MYRIPGQQTAGPPHSVIKIIQQDIWTAESSANTVKYCTETLSKKKEKKEEVPLLPCSFGVSGKLGDLHGLLAKKNISVHAGIEASVNGTAWLKDLFGSQEAQTVKSTNQPPDKEDVSGRTRTRRALTGEAWGVRGESTRCQAKMSVRLKYFFYILLNDQRGYLGRSRGDGGKTSRHCFGEFMSNLNEMCCMY